MTHQHRTNYWAHDQHETCVSHNSMRVSRRLLQWGAPRRREGEAHLVAHAEYYERALLNAVLGTQRGTVPGAMAYMYPMGESRTTCARPRSLAAGAPHARVRRMGTRRLGRE